MRGLGISPTEFWKMKPRHFWWLSNEDRRAKRGPFEGMNRPLTKRKATELLNWARRHNDVHASKA